MPLIQLPVYSRYIFELTDPSGGPPQQASVVVSLADQWLRWPEATDPRYAALETPPPMVALSVRGMMPAEGDRQSPNSGGCNPFGCTLDY